MTPAAVSLILAAEEVKVVVEDIVAAAGEIVKITDLPDASWRALRPAPPQEWAVLAMSAARHNWTTAQVAHVVKGLCDPEVQRARRAQYQEACAQITQGIAELETHRAAIEREVNEMPPEKRAEWGARIWQESIAALEFLTQTFGELRRAREECEALRRAWAERAPRPGRSQ
jgi:hypothetical protein